MMIGCMSTVMLCGVHLVSMNFIDRMETLPLGMVPRGIHFTAPIFIPRQHGSSWLEFRMVLRCINAVTAHFKVRLRGVSRNSIMSLIEFHAGIIAQIFTHLWVKSSTKGVY